MAITPTTWNPSDKGHSVTLSNGNLTTSYENYSQNRVRSVLGVTAGKWYWEVTLNSADNDCWPMLGATARSIWVGMNSQEAGELYVGTGGFAPGDVFGVAFDADAGSIDITRNGVARASVSGLTITEAWHPSCGGYDYGTLGDTTSFTANFGASPFVHTVPSGFTAGIGIEPNAATGFCSTAFGTPESHYPPVIHGFRATVFGIGTALQKYPVQSLLPTSRIGTPHLRLDQDVEVKGFTSTRFGRPRLAITMPVNQHQICGVTGFLATEFGTPTAAYEVAVGVQGFTGTQFGTPIAGRGHPVTGFSATQFGAPIASLSLRAIGFTSTKLGKPQANMRQPVAGFRPTRFGIPAAYAGSAHQITGFCRTHLGTPGSRSTYLIRSAAPGSRFGTPTLRAQSC